MIPIYTAKKADDKGAKKASKKPAEDKKDKDGEEVDPFMALQDHVSELSIGSDVEGILKELSAVSLNVGNLLNAIVKAKDPAQIERNSKWLQDQWHRLQNICALIGKVGEDIQALDPSVQKVLKAKPGKTESEAD